MSEVLEPASPYSNEEIIPLKKLLRSAFKKYQTTKKVAEALRVDQSTVVKKAKRLNIRG
ncbi:hypothetical protein [Bacillus sp. S3]|uniref:hypothetical protein n=1 Tax=Bacillus sp. S3 TaxID=486398 RepID=UPI003988E73E